MSDRRLSARDYKRPRRGALQIDAAWLRAFGLGLALGLIVAAVVYVGDHRTPAPAADPASPVPHRGAPDDIGLARGSTARSADRNSANAAKPNTAASPSDAATGVGRFDFYQMLPRAQIVIPAREHVSHVAPAAQIDQPGTYFLQVGSYRDATVAERVRAQVVKLGIGAAVQQITVGHDVWHRVRVGPIRDLATLNHLRHQLQTDKLDSLVIRVEESGP